MTRGGVPDRKGPQRVSIAEFVWTTGTLLIFLCRICSAARKRRVKAITPNAITRQGPALVVGALETGLMTGESSVSECGVASGNLGTDGFEPAGRKIGR